jgi:hypothetical protein
MKKCIASVSSTSFGLAVGDSADPVLYWVPGPPNEQHE